MRIGALARESGFSKDTIRYYEKIGLIESPVFRRNPNGFKDYPDATLRLLKTISNLKKLGFTLEEIREIIIRDQMQALDSETGLRIIEQKIIHLSTQVDKLLLYKHRLQLARLQMMGEDISSPVPLTDISMCA